MTHLVPGLAAAALSLMASSAALAQAEGGTWDFGAAVGVELRGFTDDGAYPGQLETFQPSVTIEPDLRWESADRNHQIVLTPFARIDGEDDARTHVDLREGYYRYIGDDYEIVAGAAKVFWGVTESRHLVDVINQTDGVEDIDEEDRLGQPMLKASFFKEIGQFDFFVLPYFRERTFPGEAGRGRLALPVNTDEARYEDDDAEWAPSVAARYAHYLGAWDFSVSAFHGTSREPQISPALVDGAPDLVPVYDRITQLGVTAQYTNEAWLWKFEGLAREGQGDTFAAAVAGVEYTFFGVSDSGADLGVLVEYLYDGRDERLAPPTAFENDVFAGARYALNDVQDTSLLAGLITDVEDGSVSGLLEAERRLGNNWKAEAESRFFVNVDEDNLLAAFEQDSVITLRLTRFF